MYLSVYVQMHITNVVSLCDGFAATVSTTFTYPIAYNIKRQQ